MADGPRRTQIDSVLEHNEHYAESFAAADMQGEPRLALAAITCMDSRLDVLSLLGLSHGDAHIIRNAGGVVTDDVIRSLCLSQRFLGTREILLVHHTDCGLQKIHEEEFRAEMQAEVGAAPEWALESFNDPYLDVAESMRRIRATPFVPHTDQMRGFVYDVGDGRIREVEASA